MKNIWVGAVLALIILCGAFLRLYMIGESSLWLDEAYSVNIASKTVPEIISNSETDTHPPLYFIILHYWMMAFGDSEGSIRILSALFGIAAIPLVYLFVSQHYGKKIGVICSLLISLSIFHIQHSRDARSYSLFAFAALCSFYFLLNLEKGRMFKAGYILSTLLMLNTHNFSVFYLFAQNVFAAVKIFRRKAPVIGWLGLQSIILFLYIPTALLLLKQADSGFIAWIPAPSILSIAEILFTYSGGIILMLVFIPLFVFELRKDAKKFNPTSAVDKDLLIGIWLAVPIITALFASVIFRPIFLVRATIASSFPMFILIATGIDNIRRKKHIITLLLVLSILAYHPAESSENWKLAVPYIESEAEPGDTVILDAGYTIDPYMYYAQRQDMNVVSVQYLNNITGMDRIWLVISHSADHGKAMNNWLLGALYVQEDFRNLTGIEIYKYTKQ